MQSLTNTAFTGLRKGFKGDAALVRDYTGFRDTTVPLPPPPV